MKRLLALCIGAATTVGLLAAPALAKGEAHNASGSLRIAGPGLSQPVRIFGVLSAGPFGASTSGPQASDYDAFVVGAGLVPTTAGYFGSEPDGALGPRYAVTTFVDEPGSRPIHQDLYPYATGGPVLFNPPGQKGIYGNPLVSSWWYPPATFLGVLISHGLPATAPAVGPPAATPVPQPVVHGGSSRAWIFLALIVGLALLLVAGAVVGRQRTVRAG
jgi:hypothetical protein